MTDARFPADRFDSLRWTRRTVLGALAGGLAMPFVQVRPAAAAPLANLVLAGPPAGSSLTLAHAVASGAFSNLAETVTFKAWRDPDEMRAGLTSGTMPLVVLPTTAAANLHTRGLGLSFLTAMTTGLLYVVSADASLTSIPALKGKRLGVPFPNDLPEFVVRRLLAHHGLEAGTDVTLETAGTIAETVQLVLAGRLDAAMVPEPLVTASILRGTKEGTPIHRVIDIQAEWCTLPGGSPRMPLAGLAVTDAFRSEHPDVVEAVHAGLVAAAASANADPAGAAPGIAKLLELPPPVIERSIPHSNLVALRASEARADIERVFGVLTEGSMKMIGGKLPDDGFYL